MIDLWFFQLSDLKVFLENGKPKMKIYIYIYIYSAHDPLFHFILNILADNQISKIIENDIFRRFDILSFTRSSLHYTFSKFTIKYISFYRFYLQLL